MTETLCEKCGQVVRWDGWQLVHPLDGTPAETCR